MAAFDYAEVAQDALELIDEFGRPVTFRSKSRTPADTAKPWRGPSADDDADIPSIKAAIVPQENQDEPNSTVRRPPTATLYVAHLAFPTGTVVEDLDKVVDDETTWRITKIETINPGSVKVLYTMRLEG